MAQNVGSYTNPLKKFKLVFLGEQSGKKDSQVTPLLVITSHADTSLQSARHP
jgi:hypothetical protein